MFISDGETIYEGGDGRLDTQPFSEFRTRALDEAMWNAARQRQMTIDQNSNILEAIAGSILDPISSALERSQESTAQWRQAMWNRSEELGQRLVRVEGHINKIFSYLSDNSNPPPGSMER